MNNIKEYWRLYNHRAALIFGIIILTLYSWNINIPYVGMHESTNLWYGIIAKNFLNKGFLASKFAPHIEIEPPLIYLNHPNLMPLMVAVVYKLFGFSNFIGRLLPLSFFFGALVMQYRLVREIWTKDIARLSILLAALFPMSVLYGKVIDYYSFVLFFVMLALYMFILYVRYQRQKHLIIFSISMILGMMTDWPAYFMAAILFIVSVFVVKNRKLSLVILTITVATIISYLSYVAYIQGDLSSLIKIFLVRSNLVKGKSGFAYSQWIILLILRSFLYYGIVACLLAAVKFGKSIRIGKTIKGEKATLLVGLFFYGALHVVVFREGSWTHNFWLFHLIPFFSIVASIELVSIKRRKLIYYALIFLFVAQSLAVSLVIKNFERQNVEVYELLKKINIEKIRNEKVSIPVVAFRQFESDLLPYYFNLNIEYIISFNHYLFNERRFKTPFVISISDNFSNNREAERIQNYLISVHPR